MPYNTLPSIEELSAMDDLTAAALYRTEVQRIPFLSREEQVTATPEQLVLNCLNWVQRRAWAIHRDREPQHTDMMDLVGQANVRMLEVMPNALQADDPVSYLMTVASNAMRWHVTYRDPLVTRQRDQPFTREHPATVSLQDGDQRLPEIPVTTHQNEFVYAALKRLSKQHQIVLEAHYGLHGGKAMKNEDIALMLNVSKGTVDKYLWRAKRRLVKKLGEMGVSY